MSLTSVAAQQISAPKLTPTPVNESQKRLMDEGIALHDCGDSVGAIAQGKFTWLQANSVDEFLSWSKGYQ